jgi:hypothetical protein
MAIKTESDIKKILTVKKIEQNIFEMNNLKQKLNIVRTKTEIVLATNISLV